MKKRNATRHTKFILWAVATTVGAIVSGAVIAENPVTLNLWHGWTGSDNTTALNAVINKYNTTNTSGIKINSTAYDWDTLFSKWTLSAATGGSPDVVMVHGTEVPEYSQRGQLLQLDDLLKSGNINLKGVPAAALNAAKFEGHQYAVPGDIHPLGLYYNVDLVKAAGLDPTKPPRNTTQFMNWAQKLTVKDASGKTTQYALNLATSGAGPRWLWFTIMSQYGGTFIGKDGKSDVDSVASKKALQFIKDLFDKGYATKGSGTSAADPFASKRAAMDINGPWMVNQHMAQKLNFATAPVPQFGPKRAVWANTHMLGIPKQRDEKNYAADLKFIGWFFNNYALPATTVGIIPVSPAAQKSEEFTGSKQYPYYKAFLSELPYAVFEPSVPSYTRIFSFAKPTPLTTNLEAIISGSKTVEQAAQDMKKGIDEQL